MRGFEIERTLDEVTCSMETLPEKILKIPGIALVAAGTPACLVTLYDSAKKINALNRLFLCEISSVEYSLGKQGKKIWQAVEQAANLEEIRGVIIYPSCMEVLTMWDFQREKKQILIPYGVQVEILYRGPLVKRLVTPLEELKQILARWDISLDKNTEASCSFRATQSMKTDNNSESDEGMKTDGNSESDESMESSYSSELNQSTEMLPKPQEAYFIQEIRKLANKECDILLFTPGGCASSLKCLPSDTLKHVWNTRFTDYVLGQGNIVQIAREIQQKFPSERPLYLLESAVPKFTGMDLKKIADELRKAGKEVCYISEMEYR